VLPPFIGGLHGDTGNQSHVFGPASAPAVQRRLHCGYNIAGQPYCPLTVLPSFAGRLDCAARVQVPAELRAVRVLPPFFGALYCGERDTQGVL
jgi:hypothetical protein